MAKQQPTEHGTKAPKEGQKGDRGAEQSWELVKPVDFDGEDTSLTQEHLAILR